MQYLTVTDPLRYSPSIHVNQEGYMPNYAKKAMIGQYLGSLGEMNIPASSGFKLVDANTGATVFTGNLAVRADQGWTYTPTPFRKSMKLISRASTLRVNIVWSFQALALPCPS